MQKVASRIACANFALCKLLQELHESKSGEIDSDEKNATKVGMAALALHCRAMNMIAERRRTKMRPDICPTFRSLFAKQEKEPHDILFGAELPQRIKEIEETARIGSSCSAGKITKNNGSFSARRRNNIRRGANFRPAWQQGNSVNNRPVWQQTNYSVKLRARFNWQNQTSYKKKTPSKYCR